MSFILRVNTVADPPGTDIAEYVPLDGQSIRLTRQINGRGQLSFDVEGVVTNVGQNLVTNSGFETGDLTGWLDVGGTNAASDTYAHSGAYSAHCVGTAWNDGLAKRGLETGFSPGDTFTVSVWVKVVSTDGGPNGIRAMMNYRVDSGEATDSGDIYNIIDTYPPVGDWALLTETVTLPSGTTLNYLRIYLRGIGEAYFDDVQVVRGASIVPDGFYDINKYIAPGVAVSFTEGGDLLFGGIIDSVEETGVYPGADETRVRYSVECVSFATILDRRIVRQMWIGETASAIMSDVVAEYIGAAADYPEGFNTVTWTGGIDGSTVIPRLEAFYKPVSWILDQICKLVGADWSVPPAATSIVFTGNGGGSAISQRNMIAANSGFESNSFAYWTYWRTATDHEISSARAWEGTYSYYITNTSENAGIYRNITTVEGYRYVVSAYCYNVTSVGSTMRLEVTDALGSPVATAYPQTTGAWERLVVSYAPKGNYLTVRIGGVGQAYFDAAMVELDGNMSGRAGTYLPGDALPKDAHRISLRKDRDSYVNSVTAARYEKRSEQLPGDGERRNFRTDCYMISPPEITVTDRDGVTTKRLVLSETEATANPITTIQSDISGLGWTQPSAGNRAVRMKSSSSIDINIGVRIIGTYDISGVDGTYSPVQELNGTNWVYFNAKAWTSIAAIYVEDPPVGTITIEVGPFSWSTVVELSPYQMTAGVVELPSAGLGIHMRPFFLLDADLGSDVVRVIHRSDGESGWDMLPDATGDPLCSYSLSYEPASLTANCSTDYYSGVYSENINAVFVGNIPSARKLSVYAASYEWQYNLDTHRIEQNDMKALATDITPTTLEYVARTLRNGEGGALAGPDTIHIDYHGLWIQQKVSQSSPEISSRSAAEGGSGLYEHAEILDDFWGPETQTALADGLITYYSRNTGGSLFPRQTLTFATWSYRFRTPGNRFTATLARHGLDADVFTITQVDMKRTIAPVGTSLAWEYTVTASIGRAAGDWAKRFKDLLPARRILWARTNG